MKRVYAWVLMMVGLVFVASAMAESIHFAAIGDYGSNSSGEKRVAEAIAKIDPEFIITMGDNNYHNGCWNSIDNNIGQYYHQFIGNYVGKYGKGAEHNRFFPTLGNHDWNAKRVCLYRGSLPYLEYFSLSGNQRYYEFVKGPVHFFALDSDENEPDGNTIGSKQYQWFAQRIHQAKEPFKVVYFHHAPYSSGKHGPIAAMQWPFAGLGADVVLAGHEHNYERLERNGIPFIVNGIGGPPSLRSISSNKDKHSKIFYSKRHGFMLIDADDKQMKLRLVNDKGEQIDSITINAK